MRTRSGNASRGLGAALVAVALLLGGTSAHLGAQVVRGQIVDGASQAPISGAFILLLDASGRRVAGVLSGATGAFILQAPMAGRYTLHAERIGYQTAVSDTLDLVGGQALAYRFETSIRPIDLEGIEVTGKERCRTSRESGAETSLLWEEVRKALSIAVWGDEERGVPFQTALWERRRRLTSLEILADTVRLTSGYGRTPFVSESAENLGSLGYVRAQGDGSYEFYGLDAKTLLSDEFLAGHCFRVVSGGPDQKSLVGLAFQPLRRNGPPDIVGTLWVDRATSELRYLEFRYDDLLMSGRLPLEPFGGRMDFRRLDNGDWVVSHWWLRMPASSGNGQVSLPPAGRVPRSDRERRRTAEEGGLQIHEGGGEIRFISSPGGGHAEDGFDVTGTVYDSTQSMPLRGANVFLTDVNVATTTNIFGRFRLPGVPAGKHTIAFTHPRADILALPVSPRPVEVGAGSYTSVSLAIPSGAGCPPDPVTGDVVGFVEDSETGNPLGAVPIDVAWWVRGVDKPTPTRDRIEKRPLVSDGRGRYLLCGAPLGKEIDLQAGDGPTTTVTLDVPGIAHQVLLVRGGGS